MKVTGTPRIQLYMGDAHYDPSGSYTGSYTSWADYESGSGTPALTFAYTVQALDLSSGVAVTDWLQLNGGQITSA